MSCHYCANVQSYALYPAEDIHITHKLVFRVDHETLNAETVRVELDNPVHCRGHRQTNANSSQPDWYLPCSE
jgi:hypothetical protein